MIRNHVFKNNCFTMATDEWGLPVGGWVSSATNKGVTNTPDMVGAVPSPALSVTSSSGGGGDGSGGGNAGGSPTTSAGDPVELPPPDLVGDTTSNSNSAHDNNESMPETVLPASSAAVAATVPAAPAPADEDGSLQPHRPEQQQQPQQQQQQQQQPVNRRRSVNSVLMNISESLHTHGARLVWQSLGVIARQAPPGAALPPHAEAAGQRSKQAPSPPRRGPAGATSRRSRKRNKLDSVNQSAITAEALQTEREFHTRHVRNNSGRVGVVKL